MFAVIQTGGKQYRVTTGDVIRVEKLAGAAGDVIVLDRILAHFDGGSSELAADKLGEARVAAEILEQTKSDKVIVFKKKRRHNYRRKNGHRQQVTVLRIGEIALDGKVSTAKAVKPAKKTAPAAGEDVSAPVKKAAAPKAPKAAGEKPAAKGAGNAGTTAKSTTKKPTAAKPAKTNDEA